MMMMMLIMAMRYKVSFNLMMMWMMILVIFDMTVVTTTTIPKVTAFHPPLSITPRTHIHIRTHTHTHSIHGSGMSLSATTSSSTQLASSLSYNQQSLMNRITTGTSSGSTGTSTSTTTSTATTAFPQTWVPMGSVYELDGTKPNSIYFFGQEYIIYQNTLLQHENTINQGWCVVDSTCPHRLAPLREGRIIPTTQELQCSYHGWTFDGTNQGICTSIPQLPDQNDNDVDGNGDAITTISTSSSTSTTTQRILNNANQKNKCSITSYPCVVEKNIIWAWLWPTTTNSKNSSTNNDDALTYTHLPEYYLDHIPPDATATFTRIVPYSYDILIENIMDISHVPFAHHTLQGTRNDTNLVKPIVDARLEYLPIPTNHQHPNNKTSKLLDEEDGFIYHFIDQTRQQTRQGTCTFKAPYVVHYNAIFVETNKPFTLTTLLIPVSDGYSKIIIFSSIGSINKNQKTNKNSTPTITTTIPATTHSKTSDVEKNDATITKTTIQKVDITDEEIFKPKSKKGPSLIQQFIFSIIIPRFPIWFLHTFSNRFLDSDLMLLHDQEINLQTRRRQRRLQLQSQMISASSSLQQQHVHPLDVDNTSSKSILQEYYMPSKADRSIVAIRKWITRYASAVYDMTPSSSSSSSLFSSDTSRTNVAAVPPYKDRALLFDRYNQHTKHCKHCNTMLETTLPKYKTYSYAVLSMSILLWNRHFLFRFISIGSILSFRIYNWIEHTLRYGDFDHSKNH